MNKIFAQALSIIFHPLLMPSYGLFAIFMLSNNVFLLPFEAKRIILIIVAINTLVLPLLMIPLFYRFKIIQSIQIHNHRERIIPIAFTLIPYIFSYYFLQRLPITPEIPLFILGATITITITLIISIWWKVSNHLIGIGGIVGLLFALSLRFEVVVTEYLVGVVMLSGILAWARLSLGAHKPSQIYAGFAIGSISVAMCLFLI